jgi:uncharacterized protein involved in response to NO
MSGPAGMAGERGAAPSFALFCYGFRPFFLLAGVVAPAAVALWVLSLAGIAITEGPLPLLRWHAHEGLAGFVGAAMIGFLLTAVPNWTGRRGYAGAPLVCLAALFLAARVALLPGSPVAIGLAAPLALAPIPAALALILPALVRARAPRLLAPPLLVLTFWSGQAMMLGEAAGWWQAPGWATGQRLMANMALMLVGLIGGRIVPSFTLNALRRDGGDATLAPIRGVDRAAMAALASVVVADLAAPDGAASGIAALLASMLVALRLSRWHGLATLRAPILWVLHLAYALVAAALALKAAFLLGLAPWAAAWLHLQLAGAITMMILAVMTRATLGHTGRDIVAAPATVAAYVAILLAASVRVFGPPLVSDPLTAFAAAAALWVLAFALFLALHAPMLIGRRADGKPG